jgi:hypothetical protein
MISRRLKLIFLAGTLAILESRCGSGASTPPPPPPPNISIITASLPDGMVTFDYSQTIRANGGVAPFVWKVSSGTLPRDLSLGASSTGSVIISGMAGTAQTATFTIEVTDAKSQSASQAYTLNIKNLVSAQLQEVQGQVPGGTIEIQGLSAGSFNPSEWQQNTLNWVPDVRVPMLAPQPGPFQNIYAPWPLEQPNGWRLFYGGWDGADTSNDRVYSVTTSDFLTFNNRVLVIDHGEFLHVNNENVTQLPDGSMHMICTTAVNQSSNDKPAYFSSPDGMTWNGTPEPYPAQFSDVVSIPNDPNYLGWDFNGGNVLLWDGSTWTLYYSVGIYGGIEQVYRAASAAPPVFQRTGVALNTPHYANDIKKFTAGRKTWYLMVLYVEWVTHIAPPSFSYSLSNDGVSFGQEQTLFGGAFPLDQYPITPAFLTKGDQILGVVYGAVPNTTDFPDAQIFARWLQKKPIITDFAGVQYSPQGGYGPDRQWFQAPQSGSITGTLSVYAEDGVSPLASGSVNVNAGKAYQLVLSGGG